MEKPQPSEREILAMQGLYSVACHASLNYLKATGCGDEVWARIKDFLDDEALEGST